MAPERWLEAELRLSFGRAGARSLEFRASSAVRRIALCGPSGVGKSSFLKILAGVEPRARGVLRVGGALWQDSGARVFVPAAQRRVGWVPQQALLFPHLSVRGNLLFAPLHEAEWAGESAALSSVRRRELAGRARERELEELSEAFGISELLDRRPRNLSGGEAQRVALGRALLARPRLLLLDEPFSALNEALRAQVASYLARYCVTREVALVLATHRRSEAQALCEEIWDWGEAESLAGFAEAVPRPEDPALFSPSPSHTPRT